MMRLFSYNYYRVTVPANYFISFKADYIIYKYI